ncbi:hypothetical protein ABW20_dc0102752 [Dactylellina cionopaga]|nr:hypothetical protein ABW20_dc0102752 [Dactylellina cionopaga]
MKALLSCHGRVTRDFMMHAEDLAQRLADLKVDQVGEGSKEYIISDELLKSTVEVVRGIAPTLIGDLIGGGFVKDVVSRKIENLLSRVFPSESNDSEDKAPEDIATARKAVFGLIPAELENIAAARVIEHMSMMSFVGYVNSMVVENGILRELPKAIFTQEHIRDEKAVMIEKVAGEREDIAKKRERDEQDLQTLKGLLGTLGKYM